MFNRMKKIKEDDLVELRKRDELIRGHVLIVQALEMQRGFFMRNLLPKYGLDMNKNYKIDLKTGKVEIAKEQVKEK